MIQNRDFPPKSTLKVITSSSVQKYLSQKYQKGLFAFSLSKVSGSFGSRL